MPDSDNIYSPDFAARRDDILDGLLAGDRVRWFEPIASPEAATRRETFSPRAFSGPDHGYWTVARYDDVLEVKRNPTVFSNSETIVYGMTPGTFEWEIGSRRLSGNDGDYHDVVRRLCGKQMRPSVLRSYVETLRAKARSGLDDFEARVRSGEAVDWVRGFAYMYPVFAVGTLIGLPGDLMDAFAARFDSGSPPSDDELTEAFRDFVAVRARHPGDDMGSDLVRAAKEGSPYLRLEDLHYNLLGFYLAGHLTTTHLMAWVMVELQRHPELRIAMRGDHDLIPGFIEEVLRVDPPVVATFNNVLEDTVLAGRELRAGDHVFSVYAAANRDPRMFADPARFDLARSPNPHLAFSHGTHFCLGAPLARLETRLMLEDLLHRDLPLSVDFEGAAPLQNTFRSLPISLGA